MPIARYDRTENGIEYDWWLTGPGGANFQLRPVLGKHSPNDVFGAAAELLRKRDVGVLSVDWQEEEEWS